MSKRFYWKANVLADVLAFLADRTDGLASRLRDGIQSAEEFDDVVEVFLTPDQALDVATIIEREDLRR